MFQAAFQVIRQEICIPGHDLLAQKNDPTGERNRSAFVASKLAGKLPISPKILYLGTPLALITSVNEDSSPNLAPVSSFWALGWTITLGLLSATNLGGPDRAESCSRRQAGKTPL